MIPYFKWDIWDIWDIWDKCVVACPISPMCPISPIYVRVVQLLLRFDKHYSVNVDELWFSLPFMELFSDMLGGDPDLEGLAN